MMIPIYQLPVPVSSTFHHRPLVDGRHIRLLRLHPGHYALRKDAPWLIEYEIVHVSLDAAPLFEAVSYVWGSSKKTQLIRLLPASRTLAVTEALTQVLAHLNKTSTTGYLWIDQLCVNQDDELERNHQVSMMGEIYSKARRTLVWLGEPDADSNLVLGTLDIVGDRSTKDFAFRRNRKEAEAQGKRDVTRLRTHLQNTTCSIHTKGDMMDVDDQEEDYCHQCFEEAATDRVKAACRVMSRPWFNRCWIVQEVLLAREVYMTIGDTKLSPRDFHRAIYANLQAPKTTFNYDAPGLRPLSFLTYFWDSLENNNHIPAFSCILDDLRDGLASGYFKASDPRDVIYAFLGLHSRATQLISPHYAWSVEDVYVDAATAVIEETGDLSILGICDSLYQPNTTTLPSWVPDWSQANRVNSLFGPGRRDMMTGGFFFCASGPFTHHTTLHPGRRLLPRRSRSLSVTGTPIDRITGIHPQRYPRERPNHHSIQNGATTTTTDTAGRRDSQTPDYLELAKTADQLTTARSSSSSSRSRSFAPVTVGRILNLLLAKEHRFPDDYQYTWRERDEILFYAAGRRVAQGGGAGDVLMLVPDPAVEGDEVWLLRGCPAPVVLRPVRGVAVDGGSGRGAGARYCLVGACYYEGVMQGQQAHLLEGGCGVELV